MASVDELTMRLTWEPDLRGLRRKIEEGTYLIPSEQVAEAVMIWHMAPETLARTYRFKKTPA